MKKELKTTDIIVIHPWMTTKLNLTGIQLLIYAKIYAFCSYENGGYEGGLSYLETWCNASKQAVITALKELREKKLIDRRAIGKNLWKYYILTDLISEYEIKNFQRNKIESGQETLPTIQNNGQETLPEWSRNLTEVVKKVDPIIYNNINIIPDRKDYLISQLHQVFDNLDFFDEKTIDYFAAFTEKLTDIELAGYIKFIYEITVKAKPDNIKSYFYKCFISKTNKATYQFNLNSVSDEKKQNKIIIMKCPACGNEHDRSFDCPNCHIKFVDTFDKQKVQFHKKLSLLSEFEKENYFKEKENLEILNDFNMYCQKLKLLNSKFKLEN